MSSSATAPERTYNSDFADYYDKITAHKDYGVEVDALVGRLGAAGVGPGARVLDLGCGTGHHARLMATRGYAVTAVDVSPDMIRVARSYASPVELRCVDIAELAEDGFAACYSLFNVVNCLDGLDALERFVRAAHARIAPGGMLLVEAWNPIAVIAAPPEVVERTYTYPDEHIVRRVTPHPELLHQRLRLDYDIEVFTPGASVAHRRFSVAHHLVLFTPLEIEHVLRRAGFADVAVHTALPDLAAPTATDRMLAFTARR